MLPIQAIRFARFLDNAGVLRFILSVSIAFGVLPLPIGYFGYFRRFAASHSRLRPPEAVEADFAAKYFRHIRKAARSRFVGTGGNRAGRIASAKRLFKRASVLVTVYAGEAVEHIEAEHTHP